MSRKPRDFTITLYPAKREGGFVSTTIDFTQEYPRKGFQAATADQVVAEAKAFAVEYGEGCSASVRLVNGRKPAGFDAKCRGLYYNIDPPQAA